MELLFAFAAGTLTLINPCVLPVLPIIVISALNEHRHGVLALCLGLTLTFVTLGLAVSSLGPAFGVDDSTVARAASLLMVLFGLVLLVPLFSSRFALATGGVSNSLSGKMHGLDTSGLKGQFITGAILGAVWSPCIGPTLGGAIALAAEGNNFPWAGAIMLCFALGVSIVILILATLSREALFRQRERMQRLLPYVRPITGAVLVALGLVLWFGLHHPLEIWLLENMPEWLIDFSVSV